MLGLLIGPVILLAPVSARTPADWSVRGGGTWVYGNRIVRQTDNTVVDPKKYVLPALSSAGDQGIVAQVRVDSFPNNVSRVGVSLRNDLSGHGDNFVLLAGNQVGFLADTLAFGNTCAYPWSYGNWYWMKLTVSGGTLTGKIWSDAQTESQATVCTQTGWNYFPSGAPGLNGGSFGETASFDNVAVDSFADDFNTNAPPARPPPPGGFLTSGQFLNQVQTKANALGFNLGRFIDIIQTTAQNLVCANNPNLCQDYVQGTFAVVPSRYYHVGTWMRDSTWALGALNNVNLFAAQTSKFAAAGNGSTGQIPTIILNSAGAAPWYGAGGQGNPVPDDDSNLMFAIAARLGWQTVASQSYLNNVYAWIHGHAASNGTYPATSFGWLDSFYPLGISGPGSVTVSANMQGLYAVALRALKDLGVNVPQSEINNANAQYASLTINGRMGAYQNSDTVDVSSLMGDALSLFIWNQPILSDAVVQKTIASFAEVYDSNQNFVGYKVLANANGSFLAPGMFPLDNGGAGDGGGYYVNGASWMLYDFLALYAGTRHDIPSMRDTYTDRLVRRMTSELRAGVGSTPANKSEEFLCTAPGLAGDPCQPTGSAAAERSDFGWNTFVVRLLSNESSTDAVVCATCPAVAASPTSLRFTATKAGPSGDLIAVTPPQTVTVLFPSASSAWTATVNQTWIQLTGSAGAGNGRFDVGIVNPANVLAGSTTLTAAITITPADASVAGVTMLVTLVVDQNGAATAGPIGQVETPSQNGSGVVGAIGVTGWVVDDIGISSVQVYRGCLPAEPANCQSSVLPGAPLVFIGNAVSVAGARPDVEAAFPSYPASNQAGFGLSVLTNMLPRTEGTFAPTGGQGPLTLYVIATDVEGHSRLLSRAYTDIVATPTSITMDNDHIVKPFGTIDTPAQGATVSGSFVNYGWSLTPDTNTTADANDILIPTNGATMAVFIDGAPVATVAYNQCRGTVGNPVPSGSFCNDDIASTFGSTTPLATFATRTSNPTRYRNLDAGRAAIGSYRIDTTTLTDGLHTIAWSVTDSAGRSEGVGSRFFTVLNSGADVLESAAALAAAPAEPRGSATVLGRMSLAREGVWARTGFDLAAAFRVIYPVNGVRRIDLDAQGRAELVFGPIDTGYVIANGTLRDLPPGSHLDAERGQFTWAPGPGHVGTYHLVFIRGRERILVDVNIY